MLYNYFSCQSWIRRHFPLTSATGPANELTLFVCLNFRNPRDLFYANSFWVLVYYMGPWREMEISAHFRLGDIN